MQKRIRPSPRGLPEIDLPILQDNPEGSYRARRRHLPFPGLRPALDRQIP